MKTLLSGVKPTGRPHIGNYLGAMRQFVDLQNEYKCLFMIADYHALNFIQNKEEMRQNIVDLVIDYLAIGIDPEKCVIFKQSDVPAHTELAWIFDTITTMPYLERAHAFKDAEAKEKEISVGTFNYPMLMAADILLYDTDVVPVGQDQKQHIEYARDTAEKFNRIFGEAFKLPEPLILEEVATVPGIDGQKMSKSYGNTIPLFATPEEIEKAVMSIPTDSKSPEEPKETEGDLLFSFHTLFTKGDDLIKIKEGYEKGGLSYKESKNILIQSLENLIAPNREKRKALEGNTDAIKEILNKGKIHAQNISSQKIQLVKENIGVIL